MADADPVFTSASFLRNASQKATRSSIQRSRARWLPALRASPAARRTIDVDALASLGLALRVPETLQLSAEHGARPAAIQAADAVQRCRFASFSNQRVVLTEGTPADSIYAVLSGELLLRRASRPGDNVVLGPGQWWGVDEARYPDRAQLWGLSGHARGELELLQMPRGAFFSQRSKELSFVLRARAELISRIPALTGLNHHQQHQLAHVCSQQHFRHGDTVIENVVDSVALLVVLKGSLRALKTVSLPDAVNPAEMTELTLELRRAKPGDLVTGGAAWGQKGSTAHCDLRWVSDGITSLLRLPSSAYREFISGECHWRIEREMMEWPSTEDIQRRYMHQRGVEQRKRKLLKQNRKVNAVMPRESWLENEHGDSRLTSKGRLAMGVPRRLQASGERLSNPYAHLNIDFSDIEARMNMSRTPSKSRHGLVSGSQSRSPVRTPSRARKLPALGFGAGSQARTAGSFSPDEAKTTFSRRISEDVSAKMKQVSSRRSFYEPHLVVVYCLLNPSPEDNDDRFLEGDSTIVDTLFDEFKLICAKFSLLPVTCSSPEVFLAIRTTQTKAQETAASPLTSLSSTTSLIAADALDLVGGSGNGIDEALCAAVAMEHVIVSSTFNVTNGQPTLKIGVANGPGVYSTYDGGAPYEIKATALTESQLCSEAVSDAHGGITCTSQVMHSAPHFHWVKTASRKRFALHAAAAETKTKTDADEVAFRSFRPLATFDSESFAEILHSIS